MFTLAHFSDPHIGPMPRVKLSQLASKRILGYLNWHRSRAGVLGSGTLHSILEDLNGQAADHLAVTGDLVNIGLPLEVEHAARWLATLGDPNDVSVVPGNHDAYVPGILGYAKRLWIANMQSDPEFRESPAPPSAVFPYIRCRDTVSIIGTSTAWSSPPFMATGHFGRDQADALEQALEMTGRRKRFRIVLLHHPPVGHARPAHKRLVDPDVFLQAIARQGAELILHGHTHTRSFETADGPAGPVPVIGVPSASARADGHKPAARYNLFTIGGSPGAWTCDMTERGLHGNDGAVAELSTRSIAVPQAVLG